VEYTFGTIKSIKFWAHSNTRFTESSSQNTEKKRFFTVPYIKKVSERFETLAKKFNYHIAFIITNTLKSIITTGKDKLEILSCCDCL